MPKRTAASYGDQLTGGTRDVNPQFMSGILTLSAANTATEVTLGTPIVRVGPQSDGHATIMELLKIWVDYPAIDADAAAATDRTMRFSASTTSSGGTPAVLSLDNPRVLTAMQMQLRNAFTAAGTGMLESSLQPQEFDFTDGAGHGVLVATDNIFLQALTAGQAGASSFRWKILYRFKRVSLVEYIGIVQSQQ